MDRRWLSLECGCSVIIGPKAQWDPGDTYLCEAHGERVVKRVNRLGGM